MSILRLSSILQTGDLAGFKMGDSYEAMVAQLGEPKNASAMQTPYAGYMYGDLEIWFEAPDVAVSHLVYLNQSRHGPIRIRSRLPFRPEGLEWGISPGAFCEWAVHKKVSFSYSPNQATKSGSASIRVDLTGSGEHRFCVFCLDQNGAFGLSEIYLGIREASKAREAE